ncbi:hypothetical protein HK105_207682 [Polyrhizophydium stewartii]|uniref:non-specific serine/threonine protein kinase n=1 Tax=Polyrhizophydium stewartii TaxID=2732419 RepID=A0ABR4MZT6_9FUNG
MPTTQDLIVPPALRTNANAAAALRSRIGAVSDAAAAAAEAAAASADSRSAAAAAADAQTAVVDVALSGSRLLALHASKNPLRQVLRQGETAALLMMLDKRLEEAAKAVGLTPSFGGCSVADAAAKDVSELPQLLQQLGRQLTVTTQRLESLSDIGVVLRSRAAQLPKQIREAMTTLLTALEADLQNKCGRPLAPQRSWSISSDDVRIASHVVIAETALGKVFEASWLGRHALAQMITIPPTPEAIQKVDAEATTWASLCHPNVAQIWGLCLSTDFPFAVLPPSGPSLAALVNERPNADPAMRIHLVLGIAAGMAYLHGLPTPIFHGDLRASNVMLGTSGEAQVAHFAMQETQAITKSLSQVSLAVPSVRWIAPEKYKRGYQRGPADVFAFAMTCCEIFTGRIPFFEEQQDEVHCWLDDPERRMSFSTIVHWLAMCTFPHPQAPLPMLTDVFATTMGSAQAYPRPVTQQDTDASTKQSPSQRLNSQILSRQSLSQSPARPPRSAEPRAPTEVCDLLPVKSEASVPGALGFYISTQPNPSTTARAADEAVCGSRSPSNGRQAPTPKSTAAAKLAGASATPSKADKFDTILRQAMSLGPNGNIPASFFQSAIKTFGQETFSQSIAQSAKLRQLFQEQLSQTHSAAQAQQVNSVNSSMQSATSALSAQGIPLAAFSDVARIPWLRFAARLFPDIARQNGSGLIIQSQSQIRSDVAAPGTSQAPDKSSQEVLAAGSALPADQASASQDPKSDIEIFTHMFPDWCGRHSVTLSSWKHMGKAVRFSGNEAIMYPSSSLIYKEEDERIVAINIANSVPSGTLSPLIGDITELRHLSLQHGGLAATIPREFGKLIHLTDLRLSNNNLSGEIPPEIFTLVNLRELSLHNNKLTGCISPRIGSLTKLTKLFLSRNMIGGPIPQEIGNLRNLVRLSLNDNKLNGFIPKEIGNLAKLTDLLLYNNILRGTIPRELGQLRELEDLSLNRNQLIGSIPREIGKLTRLVKLRIYLNLLDGSIPKELGDLSQLTVLYVVFKAGTSMVAAVWLTLPRRAINCNRITGRIPPELGQLYNLRELSLNKNNLVGSIPPELGNMTSLTTFSVSNNFLDGPIPYELKKWKNIVKFDVHMNNLDGKVPDFFAKLSRLDFLDISLNNLEGTDSRDFKEIVKDINMCRIDQRAKRSHSSSHYDDDRHKSKHRRDY